LIEINAATAPAAIMGAQHLEKGHYMTWGKRTAAVGRVIAPALLLAGSALGALALEPWEQILAQQLDLEQKCAMTETYNVQEIPLGDEQTLSGKARCLDGREFDFSQPKSHMKFEIRACDPTIC
jgi:hypothetical protein